MPFFPGPPEFKITPQNKTVDEGDTNVNFSCNATSNPFPWLAWFKDGNAITQNSTNINLSQDNQTIIIIGAVQRSDAGYYVCNATNKIRSVSVSAYLNVQCKYNFKTCVEDIDLVRTQNLRKMDNCIPSLTLVRKEQQT